jgi:PAS domain S-box-containing protein
MEESLRANERRFRGLFENNNDAVFIIGLDNIILAANTRAVNMLRYPVDEIVGSHASRFTVAEAGDSSAESMFPDFSCGSVPIYERQFRRADGSIIEAEINVALVCGNDGRPMHIQSIVRDITERKRIEHELRESLAREKELGDMKMRFVSIVSHEFRTPLATIQAASDVLRYYSVKMTPDQIDLRFDKIQSTVKHMVSLLEDVLTLGQAQSGVLIANLEPINLVEFCQTVLDDLRAGNTKGGEIMFACNAVGAISVDADIKLLRQIITNLVTNARKYSPNGAPVQVRLTGSVTSAVIEVVDSGIGIPEDDQKHLFEAFYRASNTGTISGTGLGLAITKRAVELHAGTISVKSTVGVGTTFIVTLPIRIH